MKPAPIFALLLLYVGVAIAAEPSAFLVVHNATGKDELVLQTKDRILDVVTLKSGEDTGGLIIPAKEITIDAAQTGAKRSFTTFSPEQKGTLRVFVFLQKPTGVDSPELKTVAAPVPKPTTPEASPRIFVFNGCQNPLVVKDKGNNEHRVSIGTMAELGESSSWRSGLTVGISGDQEKKISFRELSFDEPSDAIVTVASDVNGEVVVSVTPAHQLVVPE